MKARASRKVGMRVERKLEREGLLEVESCAEPASGLLPATSVF